MFTVYTIIHYHRMWATTNKEEAKAFMKYFGIPDCFIAPYASHHEINSIVNIYPS